MGKIVGKTICGDCKETFYFDEEDVKVRDLGAYPGVPPIEEKDKYVVCPFCSCEWIINSTAKEVRSDVSKT